MKTVLAALAAAVLLQTGTIAEAGSLAVGKKAEINVDPKAMDAERARLWKQFGGWWRNFRMTRRWPNARRARRAPTRSAP